MSDTEKAEQVPAWLRPRVPGRSVVRRQMRRAKALPAQRRRRWAGQPPYRNPKRAARLAKSGRLRKDLLP